MELLINTSIGLVKQVLFNNANTSFQSTIGFCLKQDIENDLCHTSILNHLEIQTAKNMLHEKRRTSYLMGRISAKVALKKHLMMDDCSGFNIENGVFNHPVICGNVRHGYQLSISHTDNIAVSIVFEEKHPIGIDIEAMDNEDIKYINDLLTPREMIFSERVTPLILWTSKEALSKCLKTGLTLPYKWFEINRISKIDEGIYEAYFSEYKQYKAICISGNHYFIAISCHIASQPDMEDLLDLLDYLNKLNN